jgi:hypothetical protein
MRKIAHVLLVFLLCGYAIAGGSFNVEQELRPLLKEASALHQCILSALELEPSGTSSRIGSNVNPALGGTRIGPYKILAKPKGMTGDPTLEVTFVTEKHFLDADGNPTSISTATAVQEVITAVDVSPLGGGSGAKVLYPNFTQIPVKQVGYTLDEVVAKLGKWDMVGDILPGPDGNQGYPFSDRKGYDYLICIGADNKVTSSYRRKTGFFSVISQAVQSKRSSKTIEITCKPVFEYDTDNALYREGMTGDSLIPLRSRLILTDNEHRIVIPWPTKGLSPGSLMTNKLYAFQVEEITKNEEIKYRIKGVAKHPEGDELKPLQGEFFATIKAPYPGHGKLEQPPAPLETPQSAIPQFEIRKKKFSPPDPDKLIWQPLVYPGNEVYFNSIGVSHNTPQVELRLWKLEGTKRLPWKGKKLFLSCNTMRITTGTDAGQVPCWSFPDGDPGNGYIPMRAVRMALVPPDYSPEVDGPVEGVMRLGQTYDVRFLGMDGTFIGSNRITIPDKLENDQIVVFHLIANIDDPPKPQVFTLKGRIENPGDYPSALLARFYTEEGVFQKSSVDDKGRFGFSSAFPFTNGVVYVRGSGAEEPVYAVSSSDKWEEIVFPRDAVYAAKPEDLLDIRVELPEELMPAPEDIRAIYYLAPTGKVIMLADDLMFSFNRDKIYTNEMEEFRKTKTIRFKCIPGIYSIHWPSRAERRLVRLGTIDVSASDQGKAVPLQKVITTVDLSATERSPEAKALYSDYEQIEQQAVGATLNEVVKNLGEWDTVGGPLLMPDGNYGYPFGNRDGYNYIVSVGSGGKVTGVWREQTSLATVNQHDLTPIAEQYCSALLSADYNAFKALFDKGSQHSLHEDTFRKLRPTKCEVISASGQHVAIRYRLLLDKDWPEQVGVIYILPNGRIKYDPIFSMHPALSLPLLCQNMTKDDATYREHAYRSLKAWDVPLFGYEPNTSSEVRSRSMKRLAEWIQEHVATFDIGKVKIPVSPIDQERMRAQTDSKNSDLRTTSDESLVQPRAPEYEPATAPQEDNEETQLSAYAEWVALVQEVDKVQPDEQPALIEKAKERLPALYSSLEIDPPDTSDPKWAELVLYDLMPEDEFQRRVKNIRAAYKTIDKPFPEKVQRRQLRLLTEGLIRPTRIVDKMSGGKVSDHRNLSSSTKLTPDELKVLRNYHDTPQKAARICLRHGLSKGEILDAIGDLYRVEVIRGRMLVYYAPSQIMTMYFDSSGTVERVKDLNFDITKKDIEQPPAPLADAQDTSDYTISYSITDPTSDSNSKSYPWLFVNGSPAFLLEGASLEGTIGPKSLTRYLVKGENRLRLEDFDGRSVTITVSNVQQTIISGVLSSSTDEIIFNANIEDSLYDTLDNWPGRDETLRMLNAYLDAYEKNWAAADYESVLNTFLVPASFQKWYGYSEDTIAELKQRFLKVFTENHALWSYRRESLDYIAGDKVIVVYDRLIGDHRYPFLGETTLSQRPNPKKHVALHLVIKDGQICKYK